MTEESSAEAFGLLSFGAYVPRIRMQRQAIADAIGWAAPGVKGLARGERSVANWDEDAVTMAVEAGRQCLRDSAVVPSSVQLASTTLPFHDRSNSGIVADALNLSERGCNEDLSGSRRAATSALVRMARAGTAESTLLLASDCRDTRPGSVQEMLYGHGAGALLIGHGEPIARFKAAASVHRDLVDSFRAAEVDYDYALEERWVREEGWLKIVPAAIEEALGAAGCALSEVHRVVLPASTAVARGLSKQLGIDAGLFVDPLGATVGDCGAAQPFLMLASALESAVPGETILVLGFGQGADAVLLETTPALGAIAAGHGLETVLANRREATNYTFFLALRQRLAIDFGIRSERDNRTAMSALYRKREDITGLTGGRCRECNALQFPRSLVCVKCGRPETQAPEPMSHLTGRVKSYTEDWLAYTPSPPYIYGNVEFIDGANIMLEFSDFEPGQVQVGTGIGLSFRIKDFDPRRHFRRYFWKPTPLPATTA